MLETAEGQNNAVFACFGSAAQHAQLFEQSLVRFLDVFNKARGTSLSLDDFDAYEQKLQKMTIGQLLRELRKFVAIENETVERGLDEALACRNRLMHSFFLGLGDADGLASEKSRKATVAYLLAAEGLLDRARITVNAMRIAMCRALTIEDPFAVKATSA
jgi:hypothetical protein